MMHDPDDKQGPLRATLERLRRRVAELEARRAGRQAGADGLYQGDENYRTLVNNLSVGVYRNTGGPRGRFLRANPAIAQMFGYSSVEEFLELEVAELYVNPSERERFVENVVQKGVARNQELLLKRKDGSQFWGSCTAVAKYGEDGRLIWIDGVIEDITERRQAQEALRQAEYEKSIVLDSYAERVVLQDLEHRVRWANRAAGDSVGLAPAELVGRRCHEVWHDRPTPCQKCPLERAMATGQPQEAEIVSADGRHWLIRGYPVVARDQQIMGLVEVARDITEQYLAKEAIRKSEEKFAKAFRRSPVWVVISVLADGRYLEVNEAFLRGLGYTREEVIGRTSLELGLWVDLSARHRMVQEIEQNGSVSQMEIEFRRKDGRVVTVLLSGEEIDIEGERCMVSVSLDITERKRAEQALRESEEKYRTLFHNIQDGVFVVQEDRLTLVNDSLLRMSGYTLEELLGRPFMEIIAPEHRQMVADRHRRRLAGEDVPHEYELSLLRKDGSRLEAKINVGLASYGGKKASMGTLKDMTETKRAELEKAKLQTQLQHAQKMEAIGTLASGIAHDFNNILQGIRGYVQLMELHADQPQRISHYAEAIDQAVGRATDLVQRMLAFGRKLDPELKPVNLNQAVEQAVHILKHTIPKMITIETDLAPDLALINGDPNQLEQILLNLATNAVDAMPGGGRLVIQTENVCLDEAYCQQHLGAALGDYVRLTVSDTGQGMDQETLANIFDPFFTTKEVGQGTGLGLSIVYGIVQSHGGHISCYSEPGAGTTFRIHLPVLNEGIAAEPRRQERLEQAPGGHETILVVDDEQVIREVAKETLGHFGYRVLTAASGEEALEVHAQHQAEIDLVILDIGMPGMGGIRCLRELKTRQPDLKIIVASGYSLNGQHKDISAEGAADFVAKPYRAYELLHKVRAVLDPQG